MRLTHLLILGLLLASPWGCPAAIPDEFAARLAQTDPADTAAMTDLGRWAQSNGLDAAAADVFYRVLEADPDHTEALERVSVIMDNATLGENPQRVAEVLKIVEEFGGKWQVHQAPHFIIIYNTDEQFARLRGAMLELAHRTYFDQFRKAEQRPWPLREKLVCILFAQRKPFIDFARKVDGNMVGWTSGYYSPRNNWTVFYDDADNPQFEDRRKQIRELQELERELSGKLDSPDVRRNTALRQQLLRERAQVIDERRTIENRLEAIRRITNASKTVHEATHQLAFNTHVMGRAQHYPFWLAEGMATNFEPDDPAKEFGPFHGNPNRRVTLRDAVDKRRLPPLSGFVVMMAPPADANDDQVRIHYAHAWGLFNFLFKLRHDQMRDYLNKLMDIPPGPRDPAVLLREFEDAFGPIDRLEDEFNAWLKRL